MKRFFLVLLVLLLAYFFLYKIYIPRVSAFGCFDDCFSFAAGYFINNGRVLYSDIFYNHQMLPAYISVAVQLALNPENIFDLILKHRQFVMFFGFIFNLILIIRFGLPAFLFFVFFEFSKFYIFGDRFLGETLAVYPLVYLLFASWTKLNKIKLKKIDFFIAGISTWLVVFLRETFIPLAILFFLFIVLPIKKEEKAKYYSIALFFILTGIFLIFVDFKDYYFNIFEVNMGFFVQNSNQFLKILLYPVLILTSGNWNIFRVLLVGIDLLFLFSLSYLIWKKNFKILLAFIPLILANLRVVEPGRIFYESFHMVPFYGIFLSTAFLFISEIKKYNKRIWLILTGVTIFILIYYAFSPQVFFKEKANQHEEFITNYGNILQTGSVIKNISNPKDTLFVDGYDEAIYWVADRTSSYKYSMYTSIMPNFKIYSDARITMFEKNPPDYYYGSCPKEKNAQRLMPGSASSIYARLNSFGKPSCIFVRKNKVKKISSEQWKKAKEFGYELPIDK